MKTTAVATLATSEGTSDGQTILHFSADYSDERNKAWAKWTPVLTVRMAVLDSVAEQQFVLGGRYVLTFELAE